MGAAELRTARAMWQGGAAGGLAGAWVRVYAAAWALTGAAVVVVVAGGSRNAGRVRRVLMLSFPPPADNAWHALAIFAHNLPIAVWPMLLRPAGAHQSRRARRIADLLVTASLIANVAPVGAALGAYGTRLIGYLPQLPIRVGSARVWAGMVVAGTAGQAGRSGHRLLASDRLRADARRSSHRDLSGGTGMRLSDFHAHVLADRRLPLPPRRR